MHGMKSSGQFKITGKAEVDETVVGGQEEGVRGRKNDKKKLVVFAVVPRSWQWSSRFPVDGSRVQAFAVPVGFFVSCSFLPSKIAAQSMVKKTGLVGWIQSSLFWEKRGEFPRHTSCNHGL